MDCTLLNDDKLRTYAKEVQYENLSNDELLDIEYELKVPYRVNMPFPDKLVDELKKRKLCSMK